MSAYALLYINLKLERQADMIPDHVSTTTNLTSDVLTSLYHAATLSLEHYYMHSCLLRVYPQKSSSSPATALADTLRRQRTDKQIIHEGQSRNDTNVVK